MNSIKLVDATKLASQQYKATLSDSVILTHDNKVLMQRRPEHYGAFGGVLNIFGGHVEPGETVSEALVRELHEELGAEVNESELLFLGALTEDITDHTEIVHVHFWHDKRASITGCYECEPEYYLEASEALKDPKIMDYAAWALNECVRRKLII